MSFVQSGDRKSVVVVTSMLETYGYSPWIWSKKRDICWHGVEYAKTLLGCPSNPEMESNDIRLYIIHPPGNASIDDPYGGCRKIVESLGGIVMDSMQIAVDSILSAFPTTIVPSPIRRARPVYRFVIVRHAERLDEITPEWWKTAERPQDTPISAKGKLQSVALGKWLTKRSWRTPVTKVFVSPFVRAVQTADITTAAMGLPDTPICVENGLSEGAQWMAGDGVCRKPWYLKAGDFCSLTDKIDLSYQSVKET
eukprot:gene43838-58430_t